jgi:hypothetical protein
MKSLIKGYGKGKMLGYTGIDNLLADCGEAVRLTRRPRLTPGRFLVLISV